MPTIPFRVLSLYSDGQVVLVTRGGKIQIFLDRYGPEYRAMESAATRREEVMLVIPEASP